jgi:hypothetical protein
MAETNMNHDARKANRLLGPIHQNGYVVRDIEAAMEYWIDSVGVGPWYLLEKPEFEWFRCREQDSRPEISIAIAYSGDFQLELIQQHNDAPSLYREFLDAGLEGLHHVAFFLDDYQTAYETMRTDGYTLGHEGEFKLSELRFAYFDSTAHPGSIIEIVDGTRSAPFFEVARSAARDWDGRDPIRSTAAPPG